MPHRFQKQAQHCLQPTGLELEERRLRFSRASKLNCVEVRRLWLVSSHHSITHGHLISTVNGTPYEGEGSSKGAAWEQAAKRALADLKAKHPEAVPDELYMP